MSHYGREGMDGPDGTCVASGSDTEPAVQLRDSGDMWLIVSLRRPIGQRLSGLRPGQIGLPRERRALGGRLPAGAVAVEVVTAGGRASALRLSAMVPGVVVVDEATCDEFNVPVLYYDGPERSWRRRSQLIARMPVMDTDVTCPGCGIVAWDEVVPPGNWRTSSSRHNALAQPPVVVVCRPLRTRGTARQQSTCASLTNHETALRQARHFSEHPGSSGALPIYMVTDYPVGWWARPRASAPQPA